MCHAKIAGFPAIYEFPVGQRVRRWELFRGLWLISAV